VASSVLSDTADSVNGVWTHTAGLLLGNGVWTRRAGLLLGNGVWTQTAGLLLGNTVWTQTAGLLLGNPTVALFFKLFRPAGIFPCILFNIAYSNITLLSPVVFSG